MFKILIVNADNPFAQKRGGQATFTTDFVPWLSRRAGVDVLVSGRTARGVPWENVSLIELTKHELGSRRGMLEFVAKTRRFVKQRGRAYDLILELFSPPFGPMGLQRLVAAPVVGVALYQFWREASRKYHLPFAMVAEKMLNNYQYIVVPHSSQIKYFEALNPRCEVIAIEHALPHRAYADLGGRGDQALFLGRDDWHQKGIDLLLDAINSLSGKGIEFTIAGLDSTGDRWRQAAKRLSRLVDVNVPGFLETDEKIAAFERARVILMPSRYESFGLVQLEGAAFGVPTVAFDLPCFGGREAAMYLSPPFSVAGLAQNIVSAFEDEEGYQRRRIAGLEIANRRSVDDMVIEMGGYLSRVVGFRDFERGF